MSTPNRALVGPVKMVSFWGGVPFRGTPPRVAYTPPRNTLDPRYALCQDHHVACDCREGEFAEQMSEYRSMQEQWRKAAISVLKGHRLYDHGSAQVDINSPEGKRLLHGDGPLACQCTGCGLVRASWEYIPTDLNGVVL